MKNGRLYAIVWAVGLSFGLGLSGSCARTRDEARPEVAVGECLPVVVNFRVNSRHMGAKLGEGFGVDSSGGDVDKGVDGIDGHGGASFVACFGGPGSYSIDNAGVGVDEGTSPGYLPRDVWVVQYDGVEDDALLLGRARYVELSGSVEIQAVASSVDNTLIFVANTHDATLEFGDIGTLGKFRQACRGIQRESDCYGNNYSSHKDLIMSGMYKGVVDNRAISVELFRNIARLDFTLHNAAGSGMTLLSLQLCNVPKDLYYAAGTISSRVLFPTMINYFDYLAEVLSAASVPGTEESFVFYMPSNQRGTAPASTSGKTKSENAPGFSTYIKITARSADGQAYIYKIYPGANIVNDYNISANNRYVLSLAINAPGDASSDGRIENYADIDFPSANSFILNPEPAGARSRIFTIPIDKVNEFWKDYDPSLMIGPSDAWAVELIWQDTPTPNFVGFLDLNTSNPTPSSTFQGIGPARRIALTALSGSEGNALIGLKKVGQEEVGYLWSWHLWVTPYNPKYEAVPVGNQFAYSVPGGAVHRYRGDLWTLPQARYYNKYIMDRNLGARRPDHVLQGVLYYQFGRKDPMPIIDYGNVLYDNTGTPLSASDPRNPTTMIFNGGAGVTLATGVLNPTFYYYTGNTNVNADWTMEGRGNNYLWNHPVEGTGQKSLFDPCPPGWELPIAGVWNDFVCNVDNPALSTVLNTYRDKKLGWDYDGGVGIRYWPKGEAVNGSVFYPAFGLRYGTGGGFVSNMNFTSFYWTSSNSVAMDGRQQWISVSAGAWRAQAFPVRCVQE